MMADPALRWLCEPGNPSVKYHVLKDLVGLPETDADVMEARAAILDSEPARSILAHQNEDGGFLDEDIVKRYGMAVARTGYQPRYKGTIWHAITFANLGASPEDERIKKLCGYILDKNYNNCRNVLGIYVQDSNGLEFRVFPCFVGNMVWSLSKLGFYRDERVQDSIKWLLRYQRFDDGDFKTPDEWPYRGRNDRCFGKHSCFIGCTQALKAMAAIPEEERGKEVKEFMDRAISFILLHKVYKKSHGKGVPIRKEYLQLGMPWSYFDDLPGILETLLLLRASPEPLSDAVKYVESKRGANGRWKLDKLYSKSAHYARWGIEGEDNKWVTLRALRVLKMYNRSLMSC